MGQQTAPFINSQGGNILVNQSEEQVLILDNNQIPVGLFGKDSTGAIVVKIGKAGQNVITAPNNQLIFNSNQDIFKIIGVGTGQAPAVTTVADGTNTFTGFATNSYAHGLGFTPAVLAYFELSPSQFMLMPYSEVVSAGSPSGGIISTIFRTTTSSTTVDITQIVTSYSPGIGIGTYPAANVKYYLLQESAS